jgi:hypothetical protein
MNYLRFYLGLYLIGPIAGILHAFHWVQQATILGVLYFSLPMGLPLANLLMLLFKAACASAVIETFIGTIINHCKSKHCNKNQNNEQDKTEYKTPLGIGVERGMAYANAFGSTDDGTQLSNGSSFGEPYSRSGIIPQAVYCSNRCDILNFMSILYSNDSKPKPSKPKLSKHV